MMSGKRNLDDIDSVIGCGQLISPMQTRRQQRPLKKMKSISDEIAPMLDQFSFQMSQDNGEIEELVESSFAEGGVAAELAEGSDGSSESFTLSTENNHTDEDKSDVTQNGSVKTGDDGHEVENGASDGVVTEVDGIKKFITSASSHVKSVGDSIGQTAHHIFDIFAHSDSVEGPPGNNVYVPHPTGRVMIPLGMHIRPIANDVIMGHKVLMIEEGKLAEKIKLRENDVLIAIEDRCIKKSSLIEVIELFGTVSKTFSITIMRRNPDEVDGDEISEFSYITMTVEISTDDDVVSIIVIDVKATSYDFTQSKTQLIIAQKTGAEELTRYLKINGNNTVTMEPQFVEEECRFTMNLYESINSTATVCTLCNATNSKALTAQTQGKDEDFKITLGNADDLTSTKIVSDSRFFFLIPTGVPHEHAFESIQRKDHYLTCEDGIVKVKHQSVTDTTTLNSAFRFTVCGKECEGTIAKNSQQQLAGKPNPQKLK